MVENYVKEAIILGRMSLRRLNVKVMLTVFLGCQHFVQYEFGHKGWQTVN